MAFDRNLKTAFGKASKLYESARKGYPKELIEHIIQVSGLNKGAKILDIGCGTGKSTLQFTEKGFDILALDISGEMIKIARENLSLYPQVKYQVSSFEEFNYPEESFDLIISGTAFHWLDQEVAYRKAAQLLKKNGWLATFYSSTAYEKSDLMSKAREIYVKDCPNYPEGYGKTHEKLLERTKKTGLFQSVEVFVYPVEERFTKEQFLSWLNSFSWVISLQPPQKDKLFSDLEPLLINPKDISVPRDYWLVLAHKK